MDVRPLPRPWIFGPALDLIVGCGAWSLPLFAVTYWLNLRNAAGVMFAFYLLGVFCNQPHYMATIYRAYRTPEDFNKYRFFTLYVTALMALTVVIIHVAPALLPWVFTAYLTWSPWHYTGQNYGIAMMLARRAGAQPSDGDRWLLWWAYFASYAAWFLALHNTDTVGEAMQVVLPIPAAVAQAGQVFFAVLFLVAGIFGHARLVRQIGLRAAAGPLVLFATQFVWFLLPVALRSTQLSGTYASAGALAFMHCAQYLWITTYYARRETTLAGERPAAPGSFSFFRYYLVLIVGGIALFLPGPWLASRVFGQDLAQSFAIFVALVNLHHFILDGAIWKLRDGRIARLLLGRNPPTDELHAASAPAVPALHFGWWLGATPGARRVRVALATALLGLAVLDVTQFGLTLKSTNQPALTLAQWFNPQDTRVYLQRAQHFVELGRTEAAMAELRQAIAINPHNAPAQHSLGELLFRFGDTTAALAHYDRMVEIFQPDVIVLTKSGLLSTRQGDNQKSLARFEAALRLSPHDTQLHFYLAEAYDATGDAARAIEQYELYAALHASDFARPNVRPTYLKVGSKLGDLYVARREPDRAVAWYRRIAPLARVTGETDLALATEKKLRELGAPP